MNPFLNKQCQHYSSDEPAINADELAIFLEHIPDWQCNVNNTQITRTYKFSDYYQTTAFVNAAAWVAHQQDHHPDLLVKYNQCQVTLWTHTTGGITDNDLICASLFDQLIS